jgi:hypothetical protein
VCGSSLERVSGATPTRLYGRRDRADESITRDAPGLGSSPRGVQRLPNKRGRGWRAVGGPGSAGEVRRGGARHLVPAREVPDTKCAGARHLVRTARRVPCEVPDASLGATCETPRPAVVRQRGASARCQTPRSVLVRIARCVTALASGMVLRNSARHLVPGVVLAAAWTTTSSGRCRLNLPGVGGRLPGADPQSAPPEWCQTPRSRTPRSRRGPRRRVDDDLVRALSVGPPRASAGGFRAPIRNQLPFRPGGRPNSSVRAVSVMATTAGCFSFRSTVSAQ